MDARNLLRARGLRAKKRLGQNFLMDAAAAARIAALVEPGGKRVLEIGAGTGALTAALLAAGARLTALEIDPDLIAVLRERPDLQAADILEADALRFDYDAFARAGEWRVAGNLPYNVGTPLVAELSSRDEPPERIVAMLQKDVADRLVARPSTPAYGALTLVVGARMAVRRAFTLGPSHFHPRPNVDSSVVVLDRLPQPVATRDMGRFYEVVRGGFAYRRKTLANSLSQSMGIPRERTAEALRTLALDPEARAEQLALGAFAELAAKLA
jgi:16S rRNA (adenine1518-N6/adenine1519-N6)-dimethyltransferase